MEKGDPSTYAVIAAAMVVHRGLRATTTAAATAHPQIAQMTQILPRDPKTYAVIGAAMEVHRRLGPGFLEPVYQEALEIELGAREIPFVREAELPIEYRGRRLKTYYRPDFICYDALIVELKALPRVSGTEESQLINYLKISKLPVGLLLNFGTGSLTYRRFALTQSAESAKSAD
jgi:GxxExxY protein